MKNSKKIGLIIAILVAIILLVGGALAYTYFFTDVLLNEQKTFFKYMSKNSEILEMFNDKEIENYLDKMKGSAYSNQGEFTISVSGDVDEETQKAVEELKKHKITFSGAMDTANKYKYQELKLLYNTTDVLSGAFINKNDYYGIKVNEIGLNPFIVLENNNLKQFARNLGVPETAIESIPDKIRIDELLNQDLFTKQELKQIKDRYSKVIKDNLTEDLFSQKEENGVDVYTLTISEETGKAIINSILVTLKNDEMLLGKIQYVYTTLLNLKEEQSQQLREKINLAIDELLQEYSNTVENNSSNIGAPGEIGASIQQQPNTESDNLYISVYVSEGKAIKTELFIEDEVKMTLTNDQNKVSLQIAEPDRSSISAGIDSSNTTYKTEATFNIEKTKTDNEITYTMSAFEEETKQVLKTTITVAGIKDMSNITTNVSTDVYIYPDDSLISNAQNAMNETSKAQEEEAIILARAEMMFSNNGVIKMDADEFKKALDKNGGSLLEMNVSVNEDGNFKVESSTTGNVYIVDSNGMIIDRIIASDIQQSTETEEKKERIIIFSVNLNNTITVGPIVEQTLEQNKMYIVNTKSMQDLEKLFETLGQRIGNRMMNVYKDSILLQTITN